MIGFVGNEAVAVFRIRVGREINSAALVADGYHARTDGFTSLAVVLGAIGVWLGFPLADPVVGLLITVAIFGIVWQSARSVLTRMLDGVDPAVLDEIDHAAAHVPGVHGVHAVQARWLGHRLHAEMSVELDGRMTLAQAQDVVAALKRELFAHLPVLAQVSIRPEAPADRTALRPHAHPHDEGHARPHDDGRAHPHHLHPHGGHHAPEPFRVASPLAEGVLEIIDTPAGERMRLTVSRHAEGLVAVVVIDRDHGLETLALNADPADHHALISDAAPAEPHEFSARLVLRAGGETLELPFRMQEPAGHAHA